MSAILLLDSSQSNSSNFYVKCIPPIELDREKQYEIGLISCTCWHAMPNVKTGVNDEFTFTGGGLYLREPSVWITVKIPQGAYNITDLNKTKKNL